MEMKKEGRHATTDLISPHTRTDTHTDGRTLKSASVALLRMTRALSTSPCSS